MLRKDEAESDEINFEDWKRKNNELYKQTKKK